MIKFCCWTFFNQCTNPPPPIQDKKKIMHLFSEINLFIAHHHGSDYILINKTMILLQKYFKFHLCILFCWLTILRSCTFHGVWLFFSPSMSMLVYFWVNNRVLSLVSMKLTPFDQSVITIFTDLIFAVVVAFIKYTVFNYEIHLKYCQNTDVYR